MAMAIDMFAKTFTADWQDETEAKRAFERHNADVRASVPADRLIDYRPGDGWEPICEKLGLPVPTSPSRTSTPPTSSARWSAWNRSPEA